MGGRERDRTGERREGDRDGRREIELEREIMIGKRGDRKGEMEKRGRERWVGELEGKGYRWREVMLKRDRGRECGKVREERERGGSTVWLGEEGLRKRKGVREGGRKGRSEGEWYNVQINLVNLVKYG